MNGRTRTKKGNNVRLKRTVNGEEGQEKKERDAREEELKTEEEAESDGGNKFDQHETTTQKKDVGKVNSEVEKYLSEDDADEERDAAPTNIKSRYAEKIDDGTPSKVDEETNLTTTAEDTSPITKRRRTGGTDVKEKKGEAKASGSNSRYYLGLGPPTNNNSVPKRVSPTPSASSSNSSEGAEGSKGGKKVPKNFRWTTLWKEAGLNLKPCPFPSIYGCMKGTCGKNPYCINTVLSSQWKGQVDKLAARLSREEGPKRREENIPVGLKNLGNTCYLNSFMQVWFNMKVFRKAVFEWVWDGETDKQAKEVIEALQKLFIQMQYGPDFVYNPESIVKLLGLDKEQQDSLEFGQLFLNFILTKTKGPPADIVHKLFTGNMIDILGCDACKGSRQTEQPFTELALNIADYKSLVDALSAFFTEEFLSEWKCSCGCVGGKKSVKLSTLPPVLNLQLKRFVYDRDTLSKQKIQTGMFYPRELDLTPFVGEGVELEEGSGRYFLSAILVHHGTSAYSGHYYAIGKSEDEPDEWFKYNDEVVTKTPRPPGTETEEVAGMRTPTTIEAKGAYMLVYKSKNIDWKRKGQTDWKKLPEQCQKIRKKLIQQWEDGVTRWEASNNQRQEFVMKRTHRTTELFEKLAVAENRDVSKPAPMCFLPTKLLKTLVHKELEGIKEDAAEAGKEDNDTPSEATTTDDPVKSSPTPSFEMKDDPPEPKEKEDDESVQVKVVEVMSKKQVVDRTKLLTETDWKFQDELCCHGSIPTENVRKGSWKAVEPEGLKWFYTHYAPSTATCRTLTEKDLCRRCLTDKKKAENLTELIEKDDKRLKEIATKSKFSGYLVCARTKRDRYLVSSLHFKDWRRWATTPEDDTDEGNFNESLFCQHDKLAPEKVTKRVEISEEEVDILKKYFPNSIFPPSGTEDCLFCAVSQQEKEDETQKKRNLAAFYKKELNRLCMSGVDRKVLGDTGQLDSDQYRFLVCSTFIHQLIEFISSGGDVPYICNQCLLCAHGRLLHSLSDFTPGVEGPPPYIPVTEEEWIHLNFPNVPQYNGHDFSDTHVIQITQDQSVPSTEPETCQECNDTLLKEKRNEKVNFTMATIWIEKEDKGGAEVGGTDSLTPSTSDRYPTRRRNAHRSARAHTGESYTVSSTDTVQSLKLEIMQRTNHMPNDQHLLMPDGEELAELKKSLAEYGVEAGMSLKLWVDEPVSKEDALLIAQLERAKTPEKGFKGSALTD